MPIRQKVSISETMPLKRFDKILSLQSQVCAFIIFAAIALGTTAQVFAQDTPQPQTQPSPSPAALPPPGQAPPPDTRVPPKPVVLYNLLQQRSIVFPDIAYSTERLSTGQKFQLFVDNSISVNAITWSMLGSALGQAVNSPTGYEQGWDGYAKRFGADMGREASGEFFGTFMIASVLHEDPRFYAEINPGFFHAVKYSAQRVFIMTKDDGHEGIAWSRLGGPLLAEGLANVYYPDRNRTVGDTFFRYGLDLASRAGGNMLREYWPVFVKKISRTGPSTSRQP
jgi:hypothetical protein